MVIACIHVNTFLYLFSHLICLFSLCSSRFLEGNPFHFYKYLLSTFFFVRQHIYSSGIVTDILRGRNYPIRHSMKNIFILNTWIKIWEISWVEVNTVTKRISWGTSGDQETRKNQQKRLERASRSREKGWNSKCRTLVAWRISRNHTWQREGPDLTG